MAKISGKHHKPNAMMRILAIASALIAKLALGANGMTNALDDHEVRS